MGDRKIIVPADVKEAMKRSNIRKREEQRKKTIFNNKTRMIGVDLEGLDKQVKEKYNKRSEEKSFDEYYNRMERENEAKIKQIDQQIARDKMQMNKELDNFRKINQQRKPRRRSTDLEANAFKVGSKHMSQEDHRYLLTSVQRRFDAEYDSPEERLREQKKQQRIWLQKQIQEKEEMREEKKKADSMVTESTVTLDRRINDICLLEQQCRRNVAKSMEQFNQIIAMEKMHQLRNDKKEDQNDNIQEINNTLSSDFMTEQILAVPSGLDLNKFVTTTYKGLSDQQYKQIYEFQLQQIQENKERQRVKQLEEAKWMNATKEALSRQEETDKQIQQEKRNLMKAMHWENEKLAHDQQEKKRFLDKFVHRVVPATDDFFSKFNTSSR